jgi:Flp pilus assembly protein TadG
MYKPGQRPDQTPAGDDRRAVRARTAGRGRWRRGGAVLETALVLPILLSVTFGTVEFGHFFFVKNTLQGAAREGVRAAISAGATNADVTTAVNRQLTMAGLDVAQFTVTTNPSPVSSATAGTSVSVTVSANWGTVGIRPMSLIPSGKTVSGACVMRHE